ncbi:hypothetical protein T4A_7560 [Trichinella pseudospiralis]|uniref:Uncharacterized protein n=1 Tax=Trichinella pseudospiralis TaxID=6337 RepID=A0A0V1ERL8_TRIPS|nr:hypothetical protein T4A_7560 [Trichinella pseudospiralis]
MRQCCVIFDTEQRCPPLKMYAGCLLTILRQFKAGLLAWEMTFHCPDRSEADQACNATEREQPQPKRARPYVPQLKRRLFEYYGESDDERFNVLRLQTLLDSLYGYLALNVQILMHWVQSSKRAQTLEQSLENPCKLPEVNEKDRVDQHPFSHCQKIAPFQKLDALTTDDSAAPCRGWRNTVAVTSTCFVSSYTSITSCKSNVFFFPKSDLNLSSGASNVSAHSMKRSNNIVLNFLNR